MNFSLPLCEPFALSLSFDKLRMIGISVRPELVEGPVALRLIAGQARWLDREN
jgi:hypothetical protein